MGQFLERIEFLLAGRKIYPWGEALGISKGAVEGIRKNIIPGSDILKAIREQEQVNLDWLVAGAGQPFQVGFCDNPDQLHQVWSEPEEAAADTFLLTDGNRLIVMRRWSAIHCYKKSLVSYTRARTLNITLTTAMAETLQQLCAGHSCFSGHISPQQLTELAVGHAGTFPLWGDDKIPGRINHWEPLESSELAQLLQKLLAVQPPQPGEISRPLMRAVIEAVENTALEEGIVLDAPARARIYTAAYRDAVRRQLDWKDIEAHTVQGLLEML
ncbi:hypothetical protein [Spongorhabdus nitratireducens]